LPIPTLPVANIVGASPPNGLGPAGSERTIMTNGFRSYKWTSVTGPRPPKGKALDVTGWVAGCRVELARSTVTRNRRGER
jgi:hypothetical protein